MKIIKKIGVAIFTLSMSVSSVAMMEDIGINKNQNLGIRVSNDEAYLNYDFRIPGQQVYSKNSIFYGTDDEGFLAFSTGVFVSEPTSFSSTFSIGANLSAISVNEKYEGRDITLDSAYLSIMTSLSSNHGKSNLIYYSVSASVSPSVLTLGDFNNVYQGSVEIGINATPSSTFLVGYNYLMVNSLEHKDILLSNSPYFGVKMSF